MKEKKLKKDLYECALKEEAKGSGYLATLGILYTMISANAPEMIISKARKIAEEAVDKAFFGK